jgi:hypothetical protein
MRIAALGQLGAAPRRGRALAQLSEPQSDQALVQLDLVSRHLSDAEASIDRAEASGFPANVVENLRTRLEALTGRYNTLGDEVTFLESGPTFDSWVERTRTLVQDALAFRKGIDAKLISAAPARNWKIVGLTLGTLLVVGGGFYWLSRRRA